MNLFNNKEKRLFVALVILFAVLLSVVPALLIEEHNRYLQDKPACDAQSGILIRLPYRQFGCVLKGGK